MYSPLQPTWTRCSPRWPTPRGAPSWSGWAAGEASVTELAEPFAMSQPAISKHLKVLERAGLISRGRDAQRRPRRSSRSGWRKSPTGWSATARYWRATSSAWIRC